MSFPGLGALHAPTLATLHAYALAVAAIPRLHGVPHPRWWERGLVPAGRALRTTPIALPHGDSLEMTIDLDTHAVVLEASGTMHRVSMTAGLSATEMGDRVIAVAEAAGLRGPYDRSKFEDAAARTYDTTAAETLGDAFGESAAVLGRRRSMLGERVSPVLMWPHGFDMAFEWYGTHTVTERGNEYPTQINLGFYPTGAAYFYSSPWPFDPALTARALPHGAVWHTEGWTGAELPYEAALGGDGADVVLEFAAAVFDLAAPGLGRS